MGMQRLRKLYFAGTHESNAKAIRRVLREGEKHFQPNGGPLVIQAMQQLINAMPDNDDDATIIIKIFAIDNAMSTNLRRFNDIVKIAKIIRRKQVTFTRYLNSKKREDHFKAIMLIRDAAKKGAESDIKMRDALSFASKYCFWHRPDSFVIYDSYVVAELLLLLGKHKRDNVDMPAVANASGKRFLRKKICGDYPSYLEAFDAVVKAYGLQTFNRREVEQALWHVHKKKRS